MEIRMEMVISNREERMNAQPGSLGCQTFLKHFAPTGGSGHQAFKQSLHSVELLLQLLKNFKAESNSVELLLQAFKQSLHSAELLLQLVAQVTKLLSRVFTLPELCSNS